MQRSDVPSAGPSVTFVGFVVGHGGDSLQMLTLASGLQAIGANVEILVPGNRENREFVERSNATGVPARCTDLIQMPGLGSRQRLRSLMKLLRSIESDIVHFHTDHSSLPRMVMVALLLSSRRPAVVTLHNPYLFIDPRGRTARFWSATARRTLRAVVSPSRHGTRFQRECGIPERLAVTIHNAVDSARFAAGTAQTAREALGVSEDVPIVLFSSRLDPQKRPLDAVRIFARIAEHHPRARLVVVGVGDLEQAMREEADRLGVADRLMMAGYQTNVADWLAATTVWLFPSERENFSLALLEALAAGCPILASRCPGNDEVLEDDSNSLTFEVGDIDVAAAALDSMLKDPALRARLSTGARRTSERFTVSQMVDQYLAVYERSGGWSGPLPRSPADRR